MCEIHKRSVRINIKEKSTHSVRAYRFIEWKYYWGILSKARSKPSKVRTH